jgi:hypothetical protein
LLKEGKITQEEYNSIINSDKEYHIPAACDSEHEIDKIPWARLSKVSFPHMLYMIYIKI